MTAFTGAYFFPAKLHSNPETSTTTFEGENKFRFRSRGKTTSLHFYGSVSAPVQDMREHLPHSIRVYSLQLHNVTLSNRFYKVSWLTRGRYIRVRDLHLYNAECFEWTQGFWMRHSLQRRVWWWWPCPSKSTLANPTTARGWLMNIK